MLALIKITTRTNRTLAWSIVYIQIIWDTTKSILKIERKRPLKGVNKNIFRTLSHSSCQGDGKYRRERTTEIMRTKSDNSCLMFGLRFGCNGIEARPGGGEKLLIPHHQSATRDPMHSPRLRILCICTDYILKQPSIHHHYFPLN